MKFLVFILCSTFLFTLNSCSSTKKIKTANGISEINYLNINGSKQYVLIRGENKSNPILLFLHGGPGASATALLRKFNGSLEKHFTMVYWDQRNTGKSYDKNFPKEKIKVKFFNQDVDTLVSYLQKRFEKEKVLLVGHSWGSRLGMYAIQRHPENFIAYIGIGQELSSYEGELLSYQYTLKKAQELNKTKAISELKEMGEPATGDYMSMYKTGFWGGVRQKHWLLKLGGERYQKKNYLDWILAIWFSREYSFSDLFKYGKSSAFSVGNIIYDPNFNNIDFFKEIPEVEIPVFFISGAHDYNTPWTLVQKYYSDINAPYKEFIKFDKSGHSPPFEEPERFNKEIMEIYNRIKAYND